MDKQKVRYFRSCCLFFLVFLSTSSTGIVTLASAQELNQYHLDQSYGVQRSYGSRLKAIEHKRCNSCEQKEADAKFEYLARVLKEKSSVGYESEIESIIFADSKFVNGCWQKANKKGLEIFFTVDETGAANDFAWFPKYRAGKCIKRHISKIKFPGLDKPHHAWLVASGSSR